VRHAGQYVSVPGTARPHVEHLTFTEFPTAQQDIAAE
jgi:hypothetical protein